MHMVDYSYGVVVGFAVRVDLSPYIFDGVVETFHCVLDHPELRDFGVRVGEVFDLVCQGCSPFVQAVKSLHNCCKYRCGVRFSRGGLSEVAEVFVVFPKGAGALLEGELGVSLVEPCCPGVDVEGVLVGVATSVGGVAAAWGCGRSGARLDRLGGFDGGGRAGWGV